MRKATPPDYVELVQSPSMTGAEAIAIACRRNPKTFGPQEILYSADKNVLRMREVWMRYWQARGFTGRSTRRGPAGEVAKALHVLRLSGKPGDLFSLFRDHWCRLPTDLLAALSPTPPAQHQTSNRKRPKGGRPQEHDYAGCRAALKQRFNNQQLPPQKVRVTEAAQEWFVKVDGGKAPDARTIRRRITDPIYAEASTMAK